ncbi:MAG: DUF1634 domain-containing protein [Acidobacteriota bacterium]|nr:DUF1634 domain-containing protein [Acidobacteriota bacterium]
MDDTRLENFIGNLLRAGVLLAAAVVLAGGLFYLGQHHADPVAYRHFAEEGVQLRSLAGIGLLALHGSSVGLIQLGLVLLIATPVARVVMAVAGFYLERDRLYVVVSLIVLAVLTFSLMHAT